MTDVRLTLDAARSIRESLADLHQIKYSTEELDSHCAITFCGCSIAEDYRNIKYAIYYSLYRKELKYYG